MLVLFENLKPVCMLVIEAFQSSISCDPKRVGWTALLDHDGLRIAGRATPLILEWRRSRKSATYM